MRALTNKFIVLMLVLSLFGGLTATGASAQVVDEDVNVNQALGLQCVDEPCGGEGTETNDNTAAVDAFYANNPNEGLPGSANQGNADDRAGVDYDGTQPDGSDFDLGCVGTGCDGGNDFGGNTEGQVLGPRYQFSGMTGVGYTVRWEANVREGYGLLVEGVSVTLNDASFVNEMSQNDGVIIMLDTPGTYVITITDGAFASPRLDLLEAETCMRAAKIVRNGEALTSLYYNESRYPNLCGDLDLEQYIGNSNGESQDAGEPVVVEEDTTEGTPVASTGERQPTGDGQTLRFEAGDRVAGVDIVLDSGVSYMGGDGTGNCWLNAPVGGTVTTGVINPTDDELPERVCGS